MIRPFLGLTAVVTASVVVQPIQGQVIDDAGRPLPYATLELVTPEGRQTGYADREGRFFVRAPTGASITASDSGFEPVARELSGTTSEPLVFKLPFTSTQDVGNIEHLRRRICSCPGDLFVHEQR